MFFPTNFFNQLMGSFDEEKVQLANIIKEFVNLTKTTEKIFEGDDDLSEKYKNKKLRFEDEFVQLNCEIQDIRSENETLVDEIRVREDYLKVSKNKKREFFFKIF